MNSPAIKENEFLPSDTPGLGMAGLSMCPYGFQRQPCIKNGCELWVALSYGDQKVGRCAHAWDAILKVELRQEIQKLREGMNVSKPS